MHELRMYLEHLCNVRVLDEPPPPGQRLCSATRRRGDTTFTFWWEGVPVDPAKERARLQHKLAQVERDLASVAQKVNSDSFIGRAPVEVVNETFDRYFALSDERFDLSEALLAVGDA